jgi:hypothetical protein
MAQEQSLDGDEATKACAGCGKEVLADEPDLCIACSLYGPPETRQHSVEEEYAPPGSVSWFGDPEPGPE